MAMPISEVVKLIEATAKASTAIAAVFEDKRVSARDLKHLPGILKAARLATYIDFKMVLPQLKDMSDAEKAELESAFKTHFDLADDATEATIEAGFSYILMAVEAVLAFMNFDAKVKKSS